jgi:hypothetical protein
LFDAGGTQYFDGAGAGIIIIFGLKLVVVGVLETLTVVCDFTVARS